MRTNGRSWLYLTVCVLLIASVATGCYREVAPDVESTAAADAEAISTGEEEQPDLLATAAANSELATHAAATSEAAPTPAVTPAEEAMPAPVATALPTLPVPTAAVTAISITPAPTFPPATVAATPASGGVTHIVQAGENLYQISRKYGTTWTAIAAANGIADPDSVYAGQKLLIPSSGGAVQPSQPSSGETTYVVQPGDNLYQIGLKYGLSHVYLAQYNGLPPETQVYAGQVLRIPPH
jgi:LysM repeat protein